MRQLKRSECAILPLVLNGKWYDMIASGEKKEEYRDAKPYWANRMTNWMFHPNRIVAFSRGYKKPTMFFHACTFQTSDTVPSWRKSHPEWGEPETPHYIIGLGERVELVLPSK
jgi:hypothetical protein